MFKIIGFTFVITSVFILFTKNMITDYCTYRFLLSVTETIENMKLQCTVGMPYVLENPVWQYNNFASEYRKEKVKSFFENAGKRNKQEEIEFLQTYYLLFQKQADEHRQSFDKRKKADFLSAFTFCSIIVIILI